MSDDDYEDLNVVFPPPTIAAWIGGVMVDQESLVAEMVEWVEAMTGQTPAPVYSVNERAQDIMGLRAVNVVPFARPCELGFICPGCGGGGVTPDGEYDERLDWSEYNGFLWCSVCDKDYPTAICVPDDADVAAEIFLNSVQDALNRVHP